MHVRCSCLCVCQWNYIDFVVVLGGYLSLLPGVGNVSAVRIIRVLRPLRTLNRLRKLRVIVLTLLGSIKQLANVGILLLFLFTIYSIVGVQVQRPRHAVCNVMLLHPSFHIF
jgi:hypothetical protein